jgi:CheY-like chemotaxis protein
LNKEKILVVDDETAIVEILEELFSENDFFQVSTAANGKEALEKCQKEDFQLLCVDYRMPVMDGAEFTKMLRTYPGARNGDKPIVFITSNPEQAEAVQKEYDNILVLSKPIIPNKLATIILKAVRTGIKIEEER